MSHPGIYAITHAGCDVNQLERLHLEDKVMMTRSCCKYIFMVSIPQLKQIQLCFVLKKLSGVKYISKPHSLQQNELAKNLELIQ